MAITLQDNALLTVAEVQTWLKLGTSADEVELVKDLINRASDICEGPDGAERPLKARKFENLRLRAPWGSRLRPPAWPIDIEEDVSIAFDDVAQTVWLTEDDGAQADKDVVVVTNDVGVPVHFYRALGWRSGAPGVPRPILLTYTGGFDPIPGNILEAAFEVVGGLYRSQEKKTLDNVQAFGPGPVTPSVTYRTELVPSTKAKLILDKYRVPNV